MNELAFQSATQLVDALRKKEVSVVELCDYFIARIQRFNPSLNAVVVQDFDRARETAIQMDKVAPEQRGRLCGLPMTIKESHNMKGLPTTWGIPLMKDTIASSDAQIVSSYKAAGGVFLGKTNVPFNLGDFQSYNDIYGTTNNPWDVSRTPGGSSGGAAAALAAGLTALETGSDIGGSIRNPAHYCGVYGHKPTFGIVPQQGHSLPGSVASSDIAVCGPLARSAEDLALALDIIAQPEPLNAPGWQLNLPRPVHTELKQYRVAIWANDEMCPVDDEIQAKLNGLADTLSAQGATVSTTARPDINLQKSHETYMTLMHSIMGASAGDKVLDKTREVAAQLNADDRSNAALMTRAMIASHRDWLRASNAREKLRYAWQEFFKDWDILLCPQMSSAAFGHNQGNMSSRTVPVNGTGQPYLQQVFWSGLITGPYLPSTVFPTGLTESSPIAGLPIGVQAVGAEYNDYLTIDFCRLLAEQIGGFQPPPDFN